MWTAPLALIGRNALGLVRYASGLSELSAKTAYWTFVAPFKGLGLKGRSAVHQAVLVGYTAVPIVFVISFFIGMVLAFQEPISWKSWVRRILSPPWLEYP